MKKLKFTLISSGLFSIIVGALLVFFRGSILSTAITLLGVGFIASALIYGIKLKPMPIIKILIGVAAIAFGNTFINLSMYILGIALVTLGVLQFISTRKVVSRRRNLGAYTRPMLTSAAGVCILTNPFGSIDTLFLICGILLILGGAYDLFGGIRLRTKY